MSSTKQAESKSSFEASLKRLEKIVESLEQGNVPLEDAMRMYEEGIELSRSCIEKLTQAELKLKKLAKKIDGSFDLTDIETEDR
ncbi:MAG: exodeoxyribonuclease VII small subunit [Bacteroidota bacterium]